MAAAAVSTTGRLTYNYLGRTGLKVSNICLGTMTFGPIPEGAAYYGRPGNCDEKLTHALLDRYVQWGGNFIDTADVYQKGMSEKLLGSWLVKQNRDNLVIATKVGLIMHDKLNGSYLSRKHILASVDASLRRLQTDYIDLYQIHQGDPGTPMEEYLSALNDLVRAGKVRYLGGSNLAGWEIQKINELCKSNNWEGFASLQQQYNLLNRESELEAFEVCKNEGIGVLPWSPLKGGMLSGKISRGMKDLPEGSRVRWASEEGSRATNSHPALQLLDRHPQGWGILDALHDISQQTGRSVAQISIKWLLQKKIVSSVIIGAKTLQQMDDNLEAGTDWELTANQMRALDEASQYAIPYPYDYTRAWQAARSRTSE